MEIKSTINWLGKNFDVTYKDIDNESENGVSHHLC